jgi:hypothetical protein
MAPCGSIYYHANNQPGACCFLPSCLIPSQAALFILAEQAIAAQLTKGLAALFLYVAVVAIDPIRVPHRASTSLFSRLHPIFSLWALHPACRSCVAMYQDMSIFLT